MSRQKNRQKVQQIQAVTGLKPTHFAELIRVAQQVYAPGGSVSGRVLRVDWIEFEIPEAVARNLHALGQKYQYESPHVDLDVVWEDLTPETRSWFMANRSELWRIEAAFPALDED